MKNLKVIFTVVITFIISTSVAFSQNDMSNPYLEKRNNIDVTLFGQGWGISANYSRILIVQPKYFLNTSIGIGSLPFLGGTTFPHQLTLNFGKSKSFLEVGIGGTYWRGTDMGEKASSYNLSPVLGWRKHFGNNITFRLYSNPFLNLSGNKLYGESIISPYGGISLGFSF